MGTNNESSLGSGTDGPKPTRRLQTGVRTLIVLVACCAAILWAWRHLSENYDPVRGEAGSIQKRAIGALRSSKPAERLAAIVELERLRFGDSSVAIPPLVGALKDTEAEVRVAAAEALASIGPGVARSGSGGEAVRTAAAGLFRASKDSDTTVRVAAIRALGSIASSVADSGSGGEIVRDSATILIGCLKDPESRVRIAATASLGKIASPRRAATATPPIDRRAVMDQLVAMLGDPDAQVRGAAIFAVASHSEGGDPPKVLAEGLKDESAEIRVGTIGRFTGFRQGLDPWVATLLGLAEHDPAPPVREACFNILGYAFRPPAITAAAVPALSASLKSGNAKVRSQSATLLGRLVAGAGAAIPELLRVLNEPLAPDVGPIFGPNLTLDPACAAASALGLIAPGSVEAKKVIAALMEVERSGPVLRRGWAAYALGEFGPAAEEAVPVLIKVLEESTPEQKNENEAYAAMALGKVAPGTPSADQAVAGLLPALESKVRFSRISAIEALGQFGPRAAAAIPKLRAVKDDRDREMREAAAKALLAIGEEGSP